MSWNNSTSLQSLDDYMKWYRNQIKAKYQDLKIQKDQELLNILDINESDRIEADFRKKMKTYVEELKSSSEHTDKYEAYRKEMAKVRDLFELIFDSKNSENNQKIKDIFLSTKQYLKTIDSQKFEKNYEKLQNVLTTITPEQKMKIMGKLKDFSQSPQKLWDEIQKLVDWKLKFTLSSIKESLKKEAPWRIALIIAISCVREEMYLWAAFLPLLWLAFVKVAKKPNNENKIKNNETFEASNVIKK